MRIEKFMKTLAIGSVFTFSQTTEAATISIEKAAQKIYNAEKKRTTQRKMLV